MVFQKLTGQLSESVAQINGQPEGSAGGRYEEIQEGDFDNTFGNNLTAGSWNTLAEFVVDAQNSYNVGFGKAEVESKVGRWYMVLDDGAGAEVVGEARIKTMNSNDENVDTEVKAVPTSRLNTDITDYRKQFAVGEQKSTAKVGEDSKIVLQFRLSSSSTGTSVDFPSSTIMLPATNYS